ncbi:hypothetical protein EBR96_04960 [bacterium]|nr:hypothetical protein [bacterium]
MEKRVLAGFLAVLIGISAPLMAQTSDTSANISLKRVAIRDELEIKYREGLQMEQLRLFPQARTVYLDLGRQFIKSAEAVKSRDQMVAQLPVIISAVYRLGIVTARDNYYNVHPLVYQLDSFQDTQSVIDQVLMIVGDLRRSGSVAVDRSVYEGLYFSRAYNRIGWANKLLQGTVWKNYIVYPPSDLIGMMGVAVSDLEQLLRFQELPNTLKGFPEGKEPQQLLLDRFSERFLSLPKDGLEYRTHRLMNSEDDPVNLAKLTTKRTYNQIYGIIDLYYTPTSQATLAAGRANNTLERILSKDNQPLFKLFDQLVAQIGIL